MIKNAKYDVERKIKFQGILTSSLESKLIFENIEYANMIPVILKIRFNKTVMAGQNCTAMYFKNKFIEPKAHRVVFYQPEMIFNQVIWNKDDKIHTFELQHVAAPM